MAGLWSRVPCRATPQCVPEWRAECSSGAVPRSSSLRSTACGTGREECKAAAGAGRMMQRIVQRAVQRETPLGGVACLI